MRQGTQKGENELLPLEPWQQQLVLDHRRLVFVIAKQEIRGPISDDLFAEGFLGLCVAAQKFDRNRGVQFQTYAVWWIRSFMINHTLYSRGPVRFGTSEKQRRVVFGLGKARKALGERGDDTTALAHYLSVDVDTLQAMQMRLAGADVSFSQEGNQQHHPVDFQNPEETYAELEHNKYNSTVIRRALSRLNTREREIIVRRFLQHKTQTLFEVGNAIGVSRERVRQIQDRALNKLRGVLQTLLQKQG